MNNDTQLGKWERDCGTMDDLEVNYSSASLLGGYF